MYVCICCDVKDTQINTTISQGVNSLERLQKELGVGSCCGCCMPMVQDLLDQHENTYPRAAQVLAYSA